MVKRVPFPGSIYIVVFTLAFLISACGDDDKAPSVDTSQIPQTVFFNDTGSEEFFLFTGRAKDNTNVDSVEVSGDNGATWNTAVINSQSPNKPWDVEWFYLASSNDISAGMHTVLVRASDRDDNTGVSDPIIVDAIVGSTQGELLSVFAGASSDDLIGLSTGTGSAYGDSTAALTIPVDVNLTIQGSGYGNMLTSGNLSPTGNSVATILQSDPAHASLLSVNADLTIRNVRLIGATHGIHLLDDGGPDPQVSIEKCLFDGQSGWAFYADDDDGNVALEFISSIVDSSLADNSFATGGLYLENVSYQVTDSEFYFQSAVGAGAGVLAVGSAGIIDASIFEGNALAVWASSGIAQITSSDFTNDSNPAYATKGINLSGDPGGALIRRNTIDGNSEYGLRVGGEMELILRNNAITNNGRSGVLIDSELSNPSLLKIDMGTSSDKGNNLFNGNTHPEGASGYDTQVFVTLATSEGPTWIPANWNFWGVATRFEVNLVIIDGNDDGGRATLGIGNFWLSPGGEVGP